MKKILGCLCFIMLLPFMVYGADLTEMTQPQLADLIKANKGKVIMINFFATWCPPCKVEIPDLIKLRNAFPEDSFLLVGLSVDESSAPVEDFVKNLDINYPVFMAAKSVTDAYGITSVPHNAFYNPHGGLEISAPGLADIELLTRTIKELLSSSKP